MAGTDGGSTSPITPITRERLLDDTHLKMLRADPPPGVSARSDEELLASLAETLRGHDPAEQRGGADNFARGRAGNRDCADRTIAQCRRRPRLGRRSAGESGICSTRPRPRRRRPVLNVGFRRPAGALCRPLPVV
jgi:hypothetical protein